jgi:hypothetical protein
MCAHPPAGMSKQKYYGKIYRPDARVRRRTSTRVRVYPVDAILSADGFLLSTPVKIRPLGRTQASARMHSLLPLPSPPLPSLPPSRPSPATCGCSLLCRIFFGSCCRLEKRIFFSVFGFQSPRSRGSSSSLSSPSSAGEAARRRRSFRPNSPSHPSKLYSSLGWLNSKVPKPFFPFILRLIDVDGF